ncbi:hypothetical protein DAPPUDRAFT_113602 [Daphnia pulex]|uniref:Uncharacterized protein n=1 Tax=Daphnia pulex TaxID=6669 RepID=E9HFG5_DAPPU|nr:hypothetical protein DAPPUDRAFT_113602 [Daphnia pulex]|eukprot:EFX69536.1 hypothetical protein DAPPUDRAFT_113602 [Daphnia pulex]
MDEVDSEVETLPKTESLEDNKIALSADLKTDATTTEDSKTVSTGTADLDDAPSNNSVCEVIEALHSEKTLEAASAACVLSQIKLTVAAQVNTVVKVDDADKAATVVVTRKKRTARMIPCLAAYRNMNQWKRKSYKLKQQFANLGAHLQLKWVSDSVCERCRP